MSDNTPGKPKTIFVISPIGSTGTPEYRRYRNTLEYIVKKAFHAPAWAVVRADDETSPDSITTQVIGRIVESDLIIADLTDHNPNVFYELAVAHGYQKPVIHMMQAGQKVPFDVVDQRVIFYDLTDPESVDKARGGLIASAEWLDENQGQTRNPLSAYGQFNTISNAAGGGEAVAGAIESLSRQVARLESRVSRDYTVRSAGGQKGFHWTGATGLAGANFAGEGGLADISKYRLYGKNADVIRHYENIGLELARLARLEERTAETEQMELDLHREMDTLRSYFPWLSKYGSASEGG